MMMPGCEQRASAQHPQNLPRRVLALLGAVGHDVAL
jgi:hypothetical protein